jgi:hypothetical protein
MNVRNTAVPVGSYSTDEDSQLQEKEMKKALLVALVVLLPAAGCKKEEKLMEPHYVLLKWARSTQDLDYRKYAECEAYPKSEGVFREIFRDYYYVDVMTVSIGQPDRKDARTDYEGHSYIHVPVSFEGAVVKRGSGKPYQVMRGDAVFIKFIEGKRAAQGWLLSNRTIVTVNR